MQDLMDGYFPSELQITYPDGVPFDVRILTETNKINENIFSKDLLSFEIFTSSEQLFKILSF